MLGVGKQIHDPSGVANRERTNWLSPFSESMERANSQPLASSIQSSLGTAAQVTDAVGGDLATVSRVSLAVLGTSFMVMSQMQDAFQRKLVQRCKTGKMLLGLIGLRSLIEASRQTNIPIQKRIITTYASGGEGFATNLLDNDIAKSVDSRFTGTVNTDKNGRVYADDNSHCRKFDSQSFVKERYSANIWEQKVTMEGNYTKEEIKELSLADFSKKVTAETSKFYEEKFQSLEKEFMKKGGVLDNPSYEKAKAKLTKEKEKAIKSILSSVSFDVVQIDNNSFYVDCVVKNGKFSASTRANLLKCGYKPFRRALDGTEGKIAKNTFEAITKEARGNLEGGVFANSQFSFGKSYNEEKEIGHIEVAFLETEQPRFYEHTASLGWNIKNSSVYTQGEMDYNDLVLAASKNHSDVVKLTISNIVDKGWTRNSDMCHYDGTHADGIPKFNCNYGHGLEVLKDILEKDVNYTGMSFALGERREINGAIYQDIYVPKGHEAKFQNLLARIREGNEKTAAPSWISDNDFTKMQWEYEDFIIKNSPSMEKKVRKELDKWKADNPCPIPPEMPILRKPSEWEIEAQKEKVLGNKELKDKFIDRYKDSFEEFKANNDLPIDELKDLYVKDQFAILYTQKIDAENSKAINAYSSSKEMYEKDIRQYNEKLSFLEKSIRSDILESLDTEFDIFKNHGRFERYRQTQEEKAYFESLDIPRNTFSFTNEERKAMIDDFTKSQAIYKEEELAQKDMGNNAVTMTPSQMFDEVNSKIDIKHDATFDDISKKANDIMSDMPLDLPINNDKEI